MRRQRNAPGGTIQYVVNFSCSNNEASADGCDGSVFTDPLPKLTDIYGNLVPVDLRDCARPSRRRSRHTPGHLQHGAGHRSGHPGVPRCLDHGEHHDLGDRARLDHLQDRSDLRVRNQGNVPSGPWSAQDVIPAGMSFVDASEGGRVQGDAVQRGRVQGGVVLWTDMASLAPNTTKVLTLRLRLDDASLPEYVNTAEITEDSADDYSTPTDPVTDDDSTPDTDTDNDDVIDTDDETIDQIPGDEDDHDIAALDMTLVQAANQTTAPPPGATPAAAPAAAPTPAPLAFTGSTVWALLWLGAAMLIVGTAIGATRRLRRAGGS